MARILILEDDPKRVKRFKTKFIGHLVTHVAHAVDCTQQLLYEKKFDLVFLDHDLDGQTFVDSKEKNTGMEVVRWLEKNKIDVGKITVHTHNMSAGKEMSNRLTKAGYSVMYRPFLLLLKE